ncbi:MAG: efflux RND transporter periplasmic adaptor subunit [Nevskiaceae bacterium]|nr:MAG: efflux RND transporter periplasmic adaptor subunit [Nevskiaceae bacterium]
MSDLKHSSPQSRRRAWGAARIGIVVGIVAAAAAVWGVASRMRAQAALDELAQAQTVRPVNVTHPRVSGEIDEVVLPGDTRAWSDAPIYARTSGYLKRWTTDIGTRVKAGAVLAEIDTPEVDQQLAQARADLATAQANNQLAQSTAARWKNLLATDSVSQQDADEKAGDAAAKSALLASAQANVDRLRQLQGFKNIVAPFDGVVTARNVDVGDLINPGASGQRELFHIVDTRRLRVYVQLPQSYVASVRAGMTASLRFAENPDHDYPAQVISTADAIDPGSRTMLVQLQADNADNTLLPGAYTEVHFKLPAYAGVLRVPDNTLLFRGSAIQVASVDPNGHVALKTIRLGRDFGKEVEVLSGIAAGDALVINPPDSIAEGDAVRAVEPANAAAKDGAAK